MNLWTSSLHLTYNNFLIILHRPHPKASSRANDHGANDSDICSSAAVTIASIFESLRAQHQIKYLWVSDINALFTTMIQISVELRFSNPILAINALRRFDSTLLSLRCLIQYWLNSEWILRIFEESSHVQHGIRMGNGMLEGNQPEASATKENMTQNIEAVSLPTTGHMHDRMTFDPNLSADHHAQPIVDGWEETIPQTDFRSQDIFMTPEGMENIVSLDNEWREIYWQEPGIFESFGDGLWR